MKNVLFLVTGMTPQIITETVWALACDPNNQNLWLPDEIHVLSTEDGLNQIRSRLFSQKEGFKFQQFKQEFSQLTHVAFDDSDAYLHVICDKQGNILKDLKTPEDNELAANLICQMVREFTEDDQICLHVSIAGGRKTMGFYAGYALSLYGRAQDRMSHVLVEERYESARDFFYPSANETTFVTNRDGKELKAKDAQIWLADIPFVRMRSSLPKDSLVTNASFSEVVNSINLALKPIFVNLDIKNKKVIIDNMECVLTPKEFSIYTLVAQITLNGETLYYPSKEIDTDFIGEKHQKLFNQIYGQYKNKDDIVVDFAYLSTALSTMKSKFTKAFGVDVCQQICIQPVGSGYALKLPATQIQLN